MRLTHSQRPGKALVLLALLLPAILGLLGLVIDGGLLLAAHRQAQSAADAAALAAAYDLARGRSVATAQATAIAYVTQSNGLTGATVELNAPPAAGPYAGSSDYVEVVVSAPSPTFFIQAVGGPSAQTVCARAVAGTEAHRAPQVLLALDPGAVPGLALDGGTVQVGGAVAVNSQGAGTDEAGAGVDLGSPTYGISTGASGALQAAEVGLVGGVDNPARFSPPSGQSTGPLRARRLPWSDPFLFLPPPTVGGGVLNRFPDASGAFKSVPQAVSVTLEKSNAVSLVPGVYSSIAVTGDGPGTLTFQSGTYVLLGGAPTALNVSTGGTVQGSGVLFYNTGSNFDVTTGLPDSADGNALGTDSSATFGAVQIAAGSLSLSGLANSASPFDGLLFYQRRWNVRPVTIQGAQNADCLAGTLYARWARLSLSGPGTHHAQFIAAALALSAPTVGALTLQAGTNLARARQEFLVE